MAAVAVAVFVLLLASQGALGAKHIFVAALTGPAEQPPNASPGTGGTRVTFDDVALTLRVEVSFSGLVGVTTNSHIHGPTTLAGSGTASVATQLPTFPGFPSGVTAGSYDQTFDLTQSTSYNANFITASGGSVPLARARLIQAIQDGKAYLNVHSATFPGGEIRGFLAQCVTGCGDPHFVGLDGAKYDFTGEPGNVYALVSDPAVQMNSLFVPPALGAPGRDFIGPICLAVCREIVEVFPNRTVLFNGRVVRPGQPFGSFIVSGGWASVGVHESNNALKIAVPNWNIDIGFANTWHLNIDRVSTDHAYDSRTHGIIGHTVQGKAAGQECNTQADGGCEVVGKPDDYVVPSLCSTQFRFSQTDYSVC